MALHRIKKGLDLPIAGEPEQRIDKARQPRSVALLVDDYVGMKPTMHVRVGDDVRRGQLLFEDKKTADVCYTAPAAGKISAINRGARRALQSVVIQLDAAESSGRAESVEFSSFTGDSPGALTDKRVKDLLIESGLWTALRTRPFSKVADPGTRPHSIFVTAMDSNPLAPTADVALTGKEAQFERGLRSLAKLTDGPVFVCRRPASRIAVPTDSPFRDETFSGPHPAGTGGVHIHRLDPVDRNKLVWHVNYQDVAAIGRLFESGQLDVERVVSIAGPAVRSPRLVRTRLGASTNDLLSGETNGEEVRIISGSVLAGRTASGDVFGYLGRYHHQISVLAEDRKRDFLGWLTSGADEYSTINTFISKLSLGKKFRFTTSRKGSYRAMVPIGMYERVFPIDILPTFLLRALLIGDIEKAEELGCLELDEEDLGLCSFVCPSKVEYGPLLRHVLTIIDKEG